MSCLIEVCSYLDLNEINFLLDANPSLRKSHVQLYTFSRYHNQLPIFQNANTLYSGNLEDTQSYEWNQKYGLLDTALINAALILRTKTPFKTVNFSNDITLFLINKDYLIKQLPSYSGVIFIDLEDSDNFLTLRTVYKKFLRVKDICIESSEDVPQDLLTIIETILQLTKKDYKIKELSQYLKNLEVQFSENLNVAL